MASARKVGSEYSHVEHERAGKRNRNHTARRAVWSSRVSNRTSRYSSTPAMTSDTFAVTMRARSVCPSSGTRTTLAMSG